MKPDVQKSYQLEITMIDGGKHIFDLGKVVAYEFTDKGTLYVQVADEVKDEEQRVEVVTHRYWFNLEQVAKVFSYQQSVIEGEVPLLKYRKFKSRGIDMVHQAVSHTNVDFQKVAQEVSKDPHVKVAVEKAARKASKKGKK